MRPWIAVICFLNDLVFVEEQLQQPRTHKELHRNTRIDQHPQEYKEGGKHGETGITTVFPTVALLLYPAMFAPEGFHRCHCCELSLGHSYGPSCQREGRSHRRRSSTRRNFTKLHLGSRLEDTPVFQFTLYKA
ncbi:hypothetical protein QCA50_006407 [Cerrena zonata]|uniref:Secreted protein n=1 Tax=Cerrena zonata TaxID=2478898 RepID=A0AAW0G808_9APHY